MTTDELREEINLEIELIDMLLQEISALRAEVAAREPLTREKTAAAAFLAQFYSGVENILKRISKFHNLPLPTGDTWHLDLFKRFCSPAQPPLPELFDESLAVGLAPFRQFRHVVYHNYGFQLDWERMREGIEKVADIFSKIKAQLTKYLESLDL